MKRRLWTNVVLCSALAGAGSGCHLPVDSTRPTPVPTPIPTTPHEQESAPGPRSGETSGEESTAETAQIASTRVKVVKKLKRKKSFGAKPEAAVSFPTSWMGLPLVLPAQSFEGSVDSSRPPAHNPPTEAPPGGQPDPSSTAPVTTDRPSTEPPSPRRERASQTTEVQQNEKILFAFVGVMYTALLLLLIGLGIDGRRRRKLMESIEPSLEKIRERQQEEKRAAEEWWRNMRQEIEKNLPPEFKDDLE